MFKGKSRMAGRRRRAAVAVYRVLLGAGASLALAGGPAFAQTTSPAQAPVDTVTHTLGPVVVSATRATTTVERIPLHATVVGQAQITKSSAQTLDQLLHDVPGLNLPGAPFYTTDPTGQQTKLRGVSNSKVLMLVDGIPIHDPFYTTTQWFKVPLSSVDRVEIVRGGASSVWGNLAVAGVVNIITKKPLDNGGQVDVSYQSLDTRTAAIAKNFIVGSALALRVSGDLLHTDGYQTTPTEFLPALPGKSNSSAKNGNAEVAAYLTPAASWSAFARLGYHEQNEDVGGYRFGANVQKAPDAAAGFTEHFTDFTSAEVRLWTQRESFDKSNGAACYVGSASGCTTAAANGTLVQYANSREDNPYHELGASAVLSTMHFGVKVPSVQVGVDFRGVGGEDRATTYNAPTSADAASATINRTNFAKGDQRFVGAFGQVKLAPVPRLEATLSLRYDRWSNVGGVAELTKYTDGLAGATAGGRIADSHETSVNPSIAARFELTPALSLRGAAYRSFRAPGLNNLYRSFSTTTFITVANPLLQPETLTGGEVGADWRWRTIDAGATWFQYNTDDLIASYKIPNAAGAPAAVVAICGAALENCPRTVNFNTNGQDALSRGLELTASWRAAAHVTLDGAYTYTDAHYTATSTSDPVNVQLGAVPKHVSSAGVTWQITPRWNSYGFVRHTDAMFLDVNRTIYQPAFTIVNATTSYRVSKQLEIYGAVSNLTDVSYADNATTSPANQILGLPRAFTSGMRLHF
jgi:iron complex outermembrane receptor protein